MTKVYKEQPAAMVIHSICLFIHFAASGVPSTMLDARTMLEDKVVMIPDLLGEIYPNKFFKLNRILKDRDKL